MPHVGGGGHGGGFHASGGGHFSSVGGHSSSSHTPRFDNHGHIHSYYYRRPGFYYHGCYVPYNRVDRRTVTHFVGEVFLFIIAIILFIISFSIAFTDYTFDESKLEKYALNQYSEVYNPAESYYETNILVTIVTYEDKSQYDYISIVGDKVIYTLDYDFGDQYSLFGRALAKNIPSSNNHSNLYSNIEKSLDVVIEDYGTDTSHSYAYTFFDSHYEKSNVRNVDVLNKTSFNDFDESNKASLILACDNFYSTTGHNISFLITDNTQVYKPDWVLFGILMGFGGIFVLIGVSSIVQKTKAIKTVESAISVGTANKYFEGEDPFEEYYKNNPGI